MKVFEFCPFLNENIVAQIKIRENSFWVDELHVIEANKTFSYEDKIYNFNKEYVNDKVFYHPFKADDIFRKQEETRLYFNPGIVGKKFDKWFWEKLCFNSVFYNESVQRNLCKKFLEDKVKDDDIVILSDFDEIIDSRFADQIIDEVKKHQIITVKLHYSVFYLNLFCSSCDGSPNFSYRVFIMTGRYFKAMPFSSDYLRKKGYSGMLAKEIYCLKETMGFHHSWLEYQKNSEQKKNAFIGYVNNQKAVSQNYFEKCIKDKKLYYINSKLYVDNKKKFLGSIQNLDIPELWYK
jgi:hypothetical protein